MVLWGKGLQVFSVHWEEVTAKDWQIEKNRTLRSPPQIMGQPAVSSQSHLVLGDAGQEKLHLLVQQGLWAPVA